VITRAEADESESRLNGIADRLGKQRMHLPDANVIADEIRNGIAMLKHACRRTRWRLSASSEDVTNLAADLRDIIGEHERLWLSRNRVGGLRDSARRLEARLADYGGARASSAFG